MDRFDELLAFVTAADAGSLSAAARKLGRSAPSVTRAVASLEARVGAELLRRTTRSLKLTETGERYVAVARRVLADLAEAETTTNASVASPRGLLTLTAPVTFGTLHVRPVLGAYLARYPDVRARLLLLDRVVNVIDEGVDVAVRIAHLPDSALVATPVGEVRRVVCASPAYLAAHGTPRDPAELGGHRCIAFTSLTPSDVWTFAGSEGGRLRQVRVQSVMAVNLAEAAIGAAVDGLASPVHSRTRWPARCATGRWWPCSSRSRRRRSPSISCTRQRAHRPRRCARSSMSRPPRCGQLSGGAQAHGGRHARSARKASRIAAGSRRFM
jgi:DNA-binding transcriptional LysR family regulator